LNRKKDVKKRPIFAHKNVNKGIAFFANFDFLNIIKLLLIKLIILLFTPLWTKIGL